MIFDDDIAYPKVKRAIWKNLFSESLKIYSSRPWHEMLDSDVFVVVDPSSGKKQLVAVMGNANTLYGVHLYQAEEGICAYTKIALSGGSDPSVFHDAQFNHRMVSMELCGLEMVEDRDLDLEDDHASDEWLDESLADEYLGVETTAIFRQTKPGCPPWCISEEGAEQLLDALRLLNFHYKNKGHRGGTDFTNGTLDRDEYSVSLPTYRLAKGKARHIANSWSLTEEGITISLRSEAIDSPVDELFPERLKKFTTKDEAWEAGSMYLPTPVMEEGEPHYSVVSLIVLESTGFVATVKTTLVKDSVVTSLRKALLSAAEKMGYLPTTLKVASESAYEAFACIRDFITIQKVDRSEMAALVEALESLSQQFGNMPESPMDQHVSAEEAAQLKELQNLLISVQQAGGEPTPADLQKMQAIVQQSPRLAEMLNEMNEQLDEQREYSAPQSRERYVFRVDIKGAKPPIWRRVSLPTDATFFDLHRCLQAVFGWSGEHLHSFFVDIPDGGRTVIDWGDDEGAEFFCGDVRNELDVSLVDIFSQGHKKIEYCYDFGDNWDHIIKLEKTVQDDSSGEIAIMQLLKATGPMLEDNCGGIWEFQRIAEGGRSSCAEIPRARLAEIRAGRFNPEAVLLRDPDTEMGMLDSMSGPGDDPFFDMEYPD